MKRIFLILLLLLSGCLNKEERKKKIKEETLTEWKLEYLEKSKDYYNRRIYQLGILISNDNIPSFNDSIQKQRVMYLDSVIKYEDLIENFKK